MQWHGLTQVLGIAGRGIASMAEDSPISFRIALSDAISYWEPRRLIYNGVLGLVVAGTFAFGWPVSARVLGTQWMLLLFILAVLANIAYCAAYAPDVALQHSSFRQLWLRFRWVLFFVGTIFAGSLAYLLVLGPFGLTNGNW